MDIYFWEQVLRITAHILQTVGVLGAMHYIYLELKDINNKLD